MDFSELNKIKGRLKKEIEANPVLGNFKDIQMLKKALSVVVIESDKIEIRSKSIAELVLSNETINYVIADVCQCSLDKMEKVEFFCKFLARKTHSPVTIHGLDKNDFIKLREWLKKFSGITPEERKPQAEFIPQPYGMAIRSGKEK